MSAFLFYVRALRQVWKQTINYVSPKHVCFMKLKEEKCKVKIILHYFIAQLLRCCKSTSATVDYFRSQCWPPLCAFISTVIIAMFWPLHETGIKVKVKEVDLYSAFTVVPHTQGARVRIRYNIIICEVRPTNVCVKYTITYHNHKYGLQTEIRVYMCIHTKGKMECIQSRTFVSNWQ